VTQEAFSRWVAGVIRSGADHPGNLAEPFLDDQGSRVLVVHHAAGRRVNDALGRALAARLAEQIGERVEGTASDLGFALVAPRRWKPTPRALAGLLADPLEADLRAALAGSELLRRRFRHVATRMLLVLRREDMPLGRRQREANGLLARLQAEEPDHPALAEAWREVLRDALDLDGAEAARVALARGVAWLPEGPASPRAIRVLARMDDPAGHERIREAEEMARAFPQKGSERGEGVPRGFGEAVENGPQDASRPEGRDLENALDSPHDKASRSPATQATATRRDL
jgi:Lhr-like helicase